MAFVPKPEFPNVPKLSGVPQLLRSPLFPPSPGPVLGAAAAVGALWRGLFVKSKWGVYDTPKRASATGQLVTDADGNTTLQITSPTTPPPKLVIEPDSVLDFGYKNEVDVPDYPVQNGSFLNYNRVNLPYEASVRLSKGGSETDRYTFLEQIDTLMNSLDLYQIITPERVYKDVSPIRFELVRRGAAGAFFLTEVDLFFREIRTVIQTYTQTSVTTQNARSPSAQSTDNRGTVNGETPTQTPVIDGVVTE